MTSNTKKLSLPELSRMLWAAANILRGSIDSSDYKNFIFGLMFLKHLSDRFDEEAEAIMKRELAAGTPKDEAREIAYDDPDEHAFFIPPKARWENIKKVTHEVGDALNKACYALEEANPSKLEGVLAGIDYNDPNTLGDAKARDTLLSRLIQHFATIPLRHENFSEPDMLGRCYEYLIEQFADDAGKKGGEFYTPRDVVRLLVEILDPQEGMRICDPTAGSGGMLIECAHHIERKKGNPKNLSLFAQEKNLSTWRTCKMNMLMHNLPDARVEKGDTLRDPQLLEGGELMLFDRVIANPPFSLAEWGHEEAAVDGFGRYRYGLPPKTKGDLAFAQHMLATLKGDGKCAVILPHGITFRSGAEEHIRRGMIEQDDAIEAVIGLPEALFYGTGIAAVVLVMNRNKPKARKGKILFIDASRDFEQGKKQNRLRPQDIERIVKAYATFKDEERYAAVADLKTIQENGLNLNIARYIDTSEDEEQLDVVEELKKLKNLEAKRNEAEAKMNALLGELGYDTEAA